MFLRNGLRFSNPLNELRREMDDLLSSFGVSLPAPFQAASYPALNICDCGDSLRVEAEVPGVRMEDLEIFAMGNELTIKGVRRAPEGDKLNFHRREREAGEFNRVVELPVDVDAERVEADLRDGVLTVTLPKAESAKPRKIEIKIT